MEISEAEFRAANRRMAERIRKEPRAIAANYDAVRRHIVVSLSTGFEVAFPPERMEGLHRAKPADLEEIEISPAGFDLRFPKLDADFSLPALLEGVFGSRKWMASHLGAKGGQAKTPAKERASRENGKRGGRPKKARAAA
jgi:hypothetical protein